MGLLINWFKLGILKPTMKGKEFEVVLAMVELEGDGPNERGIGWDVVPVPRIKNEGFDSKEIELEGGLSRGALTHQMDMRACRMGNLG
jgi:hypothetical protein